MLTNEQINAVVKCIKAGQSAGFDFEGASACAAFDEIIDHLESEQVEANLFGLSPDPRYHVVQVGGEEPTPEERQHAFIHYAMHWAFQLGVGAALYAVSSDAKIIPSPESENVD